MADAAIAAQLSELVTPALNFTQGNILANSGISWIRTSNLPTIHSGFKVGIPTARG
jgi:hypothetical protein